MGVVYFLSLAGNVRRGLYGGLRVRRKCSIKAPDPGNLVSDRIQICVGPGTRNKPNPVEKITGRDVLPEVKFGSLLT